MKSIGNIMKGQKGIYSLASVSVMLFFTFVILIFASRYGLYFQSGNDVNSLQHRNYSEIIDKADPDKISNLIVDHQNKNTANFNLITAMGKPHSTKVPGTMPVLTIETANEKSLEIESWMLESQLFSQTISWCKDELDKPLELEEWMITDRYFGSYSGKFVEKDLKIESWMIDADFWNY